MSGFEDRLADEQYELGPELLGNMTPLVELVRLGPELLGNMTPLVELVRDKGKDVRVLAPVEVVMVVMVVSLSVAIKDEEGAALIGTDAGWSIGEVCIPEGEVTTLVSSL